MPDTTMPTKPVYVYPLPAKTQGPEGDSKGYRISLGILWACFALPIIGVIFNVEVLLLSYFSTNIFIIFFIIYFEFYKNPIFLALILITVALSCPVLEIASMVEQKLPHDMYSLKTEASPFVAHDIIMGATFYILFYGLNCCITKFLKIDFKCYIMPFILCAASSLYFFIFSLWVSNMVYDSIPKFHG